MKSINKVLTLILLVMIAFTVSACQKTDNQTAETAPIEETAEPVSQQTSGKRVYFAAPLFNAAEREYNQYLTDILESYGYEVFLPQRDGFLATELEGLSQDEKIRKIFEKDRDEILKSDIIFIVLDGRVPDEGACVELGIAYANGLRCYGIKSDARSVELDIDINPMITGCFTKLFADYDGNKLIEQLKEYLDHNEL